jgi:hypothetical protein
MKRRWIGWKIAEQLIDHLEPLRVAEVRGFGLGQIPAAGCGRDCPVAARADGVYAVIGIQTARKGVCSSLPPSHGGLRVRARYPRGYGLFCTPN